MVSHISDFKGVQGPDLLSSSPQHHLPPLFALGNALRQSPALSFFCLGPPSACRLVGGGLRWDGGEGGPGPFPALLLSRRDLVLSRRPGERVPPRSGVLADPAWASCCPVLLHAPLGGVARTFSVLGTLCVGTHVSAPPGKTEH